MLRNLAVFGQHIIIGTIIINIQLDVNHAINVSKNHLLKFYGTLKKYEF